MMAGDVLSLASDGTVTRQHVGSVAAALRPRVGGGAVIGVERGFALQEADGSVTPLDPVWTTDQIRMNDGGCDPDGGFYCGSMAYDKREGAASLYRLAPDGSVTVALTGVTISNGLEWSPDGSLAYYNDTATHAISVFDYDRDAGLTGRRPFVQLPDDGNPDGLTVDAEGGVWTALYGSGTVHRYAPDGTLSEVIELPTPNVTACTLGGAQLDQLFITTTQEGLPAGSDRLAGALFRADVGGPGRPVREFAG
jgi:sugar lactone lactonase YvrE